MQIQNIQIPNVSQSTGKNTTPNGEGFSALLAALMGNMENIEGAESLEALKNLEDENEGQEVDMELPFPVAVPFNLMNFENQNHQAGVEVKQETQAEILEPVPVETLNVDEEGEPITNFISKEEVLPKESIIPKEEPKMSFEEKLQVQGEKIDRTPLEVKPQLNEKSGKLPMEDKEKPESFKAEMFNLQPETKEVQNTEPKVQEKPIEPAVAKENIQRLNDSIIKLIETTTVDNKSVMKVKLYPEELGTLDLTLEIQEGKLIAKITVDNESVKQLFCDKLGELNQNLTKQNINIQEFKVEVKPEASLDFNFQGEFNQDNREQHKASRIFGHKEMMPEEIPMEVTNTLGKTGELSILA